MKDWKAIGRRLAGAGLPILGAQIGGPAGAAIGRDVASRLGVDPDPEVIAQALGDPDTLLELRAMEIEAAAAERADALRAQEIAMSDVQHARGSDKDDRMRRILGPIFIFMPLVILLLIIKFKPQGEVLGVAVTVMGLAIANAERVGNYLFGTSLGSKKKGEELASAAERMGKN